MTTVLDINSIPQESVLALDTTLPNDEVLIINALFTGDIPSNTVSVSFNDSPLEVLSGIVSEESEGVNFILVDISAYAGQTGSLKISLNNSGTTESNLLVIKSIEAVADRNSGGGSGGGCSLNPHASFDPTLPILVILSLIHILRSRRYSRKR